MKLKATKDIQVPEPTGLKANLTLEHKARPIQSWKIKPEEKTCPDHEEVSPKHR